MTMPAGDAGLIVAIVIAAVASDIWRFAGALLAARIDESSFVFRLVKLLATAIIAALIARLVLYPTGALAEVPVWMRLGAIGCGVAAWFALRRSVLAGVVTSVGTLVLGVALFR